MTLLRPRPFVAAGFALTLALGLGACGGDDEPAASSSTAPETASEPDGSEPAPEETEAAPAHGAVFVDAVDSPAASVAVGEAGFDPAETSVAAGDVVVFTTAGGEGIFSVVVGDLDGYTVTSGLDEFFRFDEPGTYEVREDISGNTATVTVD